jgi:hypothetical protein
MIMSVHNPFQGGFDYYQVPDVTPINNDHPTPSYGKQSAIGVPAIRAGRPLPDGAVLVGHGDVPVGMMSSGEPGEWHGTAKTADPSGLGDVSMGHSVGWMLVTVLVAYMFWRTVK